MYLKALFVTCSFEFFSQAWNVWHDHEDVFVMPVVVVFPVVRLSFCLIVVPGVAVFEFKLLL